MFCQQQLSIFDIAGSSPGNSCVALSPHSLATSSLYPGFILRILNVLNTLAYDQPVYLVRSNYLPEATPFQVLHGDLTPFSFQVGDCIRHARWFPDRTGEIVQVVNDESVNVRFVVKLVAYTTAVTVDGMEMISRGNLDVIG